MIPILVLSLFLWHLFKYFFPLIALLLIILTLHFLLLISMLLLQFLLFIFKFLHHLFLLGFELVLLLLLEFFESLLLLHFDQGIDRSLNYLLLITIVKVQIQALANLPNASNWILKLLWFLSLFPFPYNQLPVITIARVFLCPFTGSLIVIKDLVIGFLCLPIGRKRSRHSLSSNWQ